MTELPRRRILLAGAVGLPALLTSCSTARPGTQRAKATGTSGYPLAKLTDIPVGQAIEVTLPDGAPIILARPVLGTAVAFSAICTHLGCTVQPAGAQLRCPCHGSIYDALTGAVLHGPAQRSLASVPVHLRRGEVITGTPT